MYIICIWFFFCNCVFTIHFIYSFFNVYFVLLLLYIECLLCILYCLLLYIESLLYILYCLLMHIEYLLYILYCYCILNVYCQMSYSVLFTVSYTQPVPVQDVSQLPVYMTPASEPPNVNPVPLDMSLIRTTRSAMVRI